jgi:hypothetical protein
MRIIFSNHEFSDGHGKIHIRHGTSLRTSVSPKPTQNRDSRLEVARYANA